MNMACRLIKILGVSLTLLTVLPVLVVQAAERETSTDRPGLDYRDFELAIPLPDQCEAACNKEKQCRAWTFAWPGKKGTRAHCFLKSGLPPKKSDNCCISGIKTKQTAEPEPQQPAPAQPPQPPSQPEPEPAPVVDKEQACRDYANTAVEQNQKNEDMLCDLSGSRWGYGFDVYYNWCMSKSTEESRKSNTEARERDLQQCRVFFGIPDEKPPEPRDLARENQCREYASRSTEQAEKAREMQCGYAGPRWVTAYQQHFSWCMSVPESFLAREVDERKSALEVCRPRQSTGEGCQQYARSAFRLARRNFERRCGFHGSALDPQHGYTRRHGVSGQHLTSASRSRQPVTARWQRVPVARATSAPAPSTPRQPFATPTTIAVATAALLARAGSPIMSITSFPACRQHHRNASRSVATGCRLC